MNKRIKKKNEQRQQAQKIFKKIFELVLKETVEQMANKLLYGSTGKSKEQEIKLEPHIIPYDIQKEIFSRMQGQENYDTVD